MRKFAISSYKFSLDNQELWKYIGVSNKKPYLEISKSHSDNNHKFYTYVWESMLKSKREAFKSKDADINTRKAGADPNVVNLSPES